MTWKTAREGRRCLYWFCGWGGCDSGTGGEDRAGDWLIWAIFGVEAGPVAGARVKVGATMGSPTAGRLSVV